MLEKAKELPNPVSATEPLYEVVLAEDLIALTREAILAPGAERARGWWSCALAACSASGAGRRR